MRNLLATVPHAAREPVAALVRTIFAQPDHATALAQLPKIAEGLRARFPQATALLLEAAEDILAYRHSPIDHRARLHSTNPLERLHKEVKRRSAVVGIFPNRAALLRLVGAILAEQDDEWAVADRRYFSAESMKLLTQPLVTASQEDLLTAIAQPNTTGEMRFGNLHHLTGPYLAGDGEHHKPERRNECSHGPARGHALRRLSDARIRAVRDWHRSCSAGEYGTGRHVGPLPGSGDSLGVAVPQLRSRRARPS
jgi:hypothetical protein